MDARYESQLKRCADRFEELKREVLMLDFVVLGSLQHRSRECGNKGCRCHANPRDRHGPYWYWTRKVNAKTVSLVLSDAQARSFAGWIQNSRELERIIREMRKVSARAAALVAGLEHSRVAYSSTGRAKR